MKVKDLVGKMGFVSQEVKAEIKRGSEILFTDNPLKMQSPLWDIKRNVMEKTVACFSVKDNTISIYIK